MATIRPVPLDEKSPGLQALWKPRQPLLEAAAFFMLGIALGELLLPFGSSVWIGACSLAVGVGAYSAMSRSARTQSIAFWLVALLCGLALHTGKIDRSPARRLSAMLSSESAILHGSGIVAEKPVPGRARLTVRLEKGTLHGKPVPTGGLLLVQWPQAVLPNYGDRIEFRGTLSNLGRARNPGSFDTLAIRKRQGIYSQVAIRYTSDAEVIAHHKGNPLITLALRSREKMEQSMTLGLEHAPDVVSVIQSTTLGTQVETSETILDLFRHTGTIHLFSVSGLHVAMLAAMLFTLLRILGVPRRGVALIVIPVLWGYCFITGLPPGSVRATIMGTVAMLGLALERPALSWNALGAAALGILIVEPEQLFRPGFQLSFLLVAALLAGAEPLQKRLVPLVQPDPYLPQILWSRRQQFQAWAGGLTLSSASVSLVAWIATIPITLWYFHLWSPSTVPANLVAIALSWFILALGLASGLIGSFWAGLALLLNKINWLFTKALLGALAFFAALPGGHRYVERPSLDERPVCEIESLDLAGGAAIFLRLRTDGGTKDWLIDCGGVGQFRWTLQPYLRSRGVNRLDGLILTHGDSRHVGGALGLLEHYPITEVFDSTRRDRSSSRRAIQEKLAEQQKGRSLLQRGDDITLAPGAVLHVLHPPGTHSLRTADDKALVLRLDLDLGQGRTQRVLFTSDAGFATAHLLLEHPQELTASVWIMGLHASDPFAAGNLLKTVQPQVLVINSAAFPRAQRPAPDWIAQAEARKARLFLQHESGAVRIEIFRDGRIVPRSYVEHLSTSSEPIRAGE